MADRNPEDEAFLIDLFDEWWVKWPVKRRESKKAAKNAWLKVFYTDPKIPRKGWEYFAKDVLFKAIDEQVSYKKMIFDKYPTPEERKRKDIFVSRLPMPSTWLNGGRWQDPVPVFEDAVEKPRFVHTCSECSEVADQSVGDIYYCGWHWTKKFNKKAVERMAEGLVNVNMQKRKGESRLEWTERCRDFVLGTDLGKVLKRL